MKNTTFKKNMLYILAFLPIFVFWGIFYISKYISSVLTTALIAFFIVLWMFLILYIIKKIKKYNFYILTEEKNNIVENIQSNMFFENCEKRLIDDGFEKNVDIYEDGETLLTAKCFYKNTTTSTGLEGKIIIFISGVKSFYDLINTENDLKNSILNCSDQNRKYISYSQAVCILSPYPENEIYNFCCGNFYGPDDNLIFIACNTDTCKAYYSVPKKIKNKNFAKSVEMIKKYLILK